jgi:predicted metal-dependent hydrolase
MSQKSSRISELVKSRQGGELEAHYLGYFDCFNQQRFFEAHEVLEQLWLKERRGPKDLFYRGLIQFAGAFVHLQRGRPQSAASLFRLAQRNLAGYGPIYSSLDITRILALIGRWLAELQMPHPSASYLTAENAPRLELLPPGQPGETGP